MRSDGGPDALDYQSRQWRRERVIDDAKREVERVRLEIQEDRKRARFTAPIPLPAERS